MTFTQYLHEITKEIWRDSKYHPFVQELVTGKLPIEIFRFYLIQDTYYLYHFAKAHQEIIDRTDNQRIIQSQQFCKAGLEASELTIRNDFFKQLNLTKTEREKTPIAPTAYNYVSHIYRQFLDGSLASALSSLLPCYWLYYEIGETFATKTSPVPIYQAFLDTYHSDGFKQVLDELIQLVDELADHASLEERKQMEEAFVRSSYYELSFWEMSYTKEGW